MIERDLMIGAPDQSGARNAAKNLMNAAISLSLVFQFARGDHTPGAAERADEFPLLPQLRTDIAAP